MSDPSQRSEKLPPNLAVITLRPIMEGDVPVLYVSHDADDGCWQFLDGQTPDLAKAIMVGLAELLSIDPSLAQITDLPLGWTASRETTASKWERRPDGTEPNR